MRLGEAKGSGLGHGTGLLVIDVAAHTTGVDAWKNHRDSSGSQGQAEEKNRSADASRLPAAYKATTNLLFTNTCGTFKCG